MAKIRVAALFIVPLAIWGIWFAVYHKEIDDTPTYLTVVLIGIIQALVAAASGYLAVEALPPSDLEIKRGSYISVFAGLAISLFFATCIIGYLNDKSQKESKKIAADANGRIVDIQKCQKNPACSLPDLNRLIANAYPIPSKSPGHRQQSGVPAALSPVVAPSLDDFDLSSTDIHVAINELASALDRLDATAEAQRGQIGQTIQREALAKGLSPLGLIPNKFQPQFRAIDKEQTMAYVNDFLPKIAYIREKALNHVPASFLVGDEDNFQSANKLAMGPNRIPRTGRDLWNEMARKDARMSFYLRNLSSNASENFPQS
jgi:hypothetical protein